MCLANMPDKQAAALIAVESPARKASYPERILDTALVLKTCTRVNNDEQGLHEKMLELPGAAEAQSFFQEGCPDDRLTLLPHQHAFLHGREGWGFRRRRRA